MICKCNEGDYYCPRCGYSLTIKFEVGDLALRRMDLPAGEEFVAPVRVVEVLKGWLSGPLQQVVVEHVVDFVWDLAGGVIGAAELGAKATVYGRDLKKVNVVELMAAIERANEKQG